MDSTKDTITDVVVNILNAPFITLKESKIPNLWYHNEIDKIFYLTSKGFKLLKVGSKKTMIKKGFIKDE